MALVLSVWCFGALACMPLLFERYFKNGQSCSISLNLLLQRTDLETVEKRKKVGNEEQLKPVKVAPNKVK